MPRARSSADEIRVPARKLCHHGFCGVPVPVGASTRSSGRAPRRACPAEGAVGHVGEDDEADRRIGLEQPPDCALHVRVALLFDAERQVENEDACRATRKEAAFPYVEVARRRRGSCEQRERRSSEDDPQRERPPAGERHREGVAALDGAASVRPEAHHPPPRRLLICLGGSSTTSTARTSVARPRVFATGGTSSDHASPRARRASARSTSRASSSSAISSSARRWSAPPFERTSASRRTSACSSGARIGSGSTGLGSGPASDAEGAPGSRARRG